MHVRTEITAPWREILYTLLGAALAVGVLLLAGCGDDAGTTAAATDLTVDGGGALELAETEYDFGDKPVGEFAIEQFEIRNTGDGPLTLGEPEIKRLEGC